ncbi:MAG: zinc ribbon domain-containing protein [Bacteroidota bacterium]
MSIKPHSYCQSCGYPLKKDKHGGGTEKDGSISPKYCSMCYKNGAFLTPPEIDTAKKMQAFCIDQMKKSGFNGMIAWLATRSIPKLERWRNN